MSRAESVSSSVASLKSYFHNISLSGLLWLKAFISSGCDCIFMTESLTCCIVNIHVNYLVSESYHEGRGVGNRPHAFLTHGKTICNLKEIQTKDASAKWAIMRNWYCRETCKEFLMFLSDVLFVSSYWITAREKFTVSVDVSKSCTQTTIWHFGQNAVVFFLISLAM